MNGTGKVLLAGMLISAFHSAPSCVAAVIYTRPSPVPFTDNVNTGVDFNFELDVTGDGNWDFNFLSGCCAGVAARTAPGFSILGWSEEVFGFTGPRSVVKGHLFGAMIGADSAIGELQFHSEPLEPTRTEGAILLNYNPRIFGNGFGNWYHQEPMVGDRYLGFRWDLPDGPHYGYLRVNIPILGNGQLVMFEEWAWESEPGRPIVTGAVPEPCSGLLVLAAIGFATGRRRSGSH